MEIWTVTCANLGFLEASEKLSQNTQEEADSNGNAEACGSKTMSLVPKISSWTRAVRLGAGWFEILDVTIPTSQDPSWGEAWEISEGELWERRELQGRTEAWGKGDTKGFLRVFL